MRPSADARTAQSPRGLWARALRLLPSQRAGLGQKIADGTEMTDMTESGDMKCGPQTGVEENNLEAINDGPAKSHLFARGAVTEEEAPLVVAACSEVDETPSAPSMDEEDMPLDERSHRRPLSTKLLTTWLGKRQLPIVSVMPDRAVVSTDGQLVKLLTEVRYPAEIDASRVSALDVVLVVDIARIGSLLAFEDQLVAVINGLSDRDRLALVTSRPAGDQQPVLHALKRMTDEHKAASFHLALALAGPATPADVLVALARAGMVLRERAAVSAASLLLLLTDQLARPEGELSLIQSLLQPAQRQGACVAVLGVGVPGEMARWHRVGRALDAPCVAPRAADVETVVGWVLDAPRCVHFRELEVTVRVLAPSARLVTLQVAGGQALLQDNGGDAVVRFERLYLREVQQMIVTVSLADTEEPADAAPLVAVQLKAREVGEGASGRVCSTRTVCRIQRLATGCAAPPPSAPLRHLELLLQVTAALDQAAALACCGLERERAQDLLAGAYLRLALDEEAQRADKTFALLLHELEYAMKSLSEPATVHR